jgi:hypothetical protein
VLHYESLCAQHSAYPSFLSGVQTRPRGIRVAEFDWTIESNGFADSGPCDLIVRERFTKIYGFGHENSIYAPAHNGTYAPPMSRPYCRLWAA